MIVCAFTIRRNLALKQKRRSQLSTRQDGRRTELDHQVHRLLFAQIIFYVIFTIPQLGNLVFNTISITNPNRSREHLAVERFVNFMAELMLYLFPVTSFYLYTLTARTFRSEIHHLMHSLCLWNFGNQITPNVISALPRPPLEIDLSRIDGSVKQICPVKTDAQDTCKSIQS